MSGQKKKAAEPTPELAAVIQGPYEPGCAALVCPDCSGTGKMLPGGCPCDTCKGRRAVRVVIASLPALQPYAGQAAQS